MAGIEIDDAQFQAWAKRVNSKIATDEVRHGLELTMQRVKAQSMRAVKSQTPVDTGHLRRVWHVDGPFISGAVIELRLYNNAEYAQFVENGHRTRGGGGWVEGRFMLKNSLQTIDEQLPLLISPALNKALRGLLD